MTKEFLTKNWLWFVVFGLMAFLYLDKSEESRVKDKIIQEVIERHDQDKAELDMMIGRLNLTIDSLDNTLDSLNIRSNQIKMDIEKVQDERKKIINTVPDYPTSKLDSILANHRHR